VNRSMSLVLSSVLGAGCLAAQLPDKVTIEQAVQEAVEHNLGLLAERYNLTVADARIITAKLRPNPVLTTGVDYIDFLHQFTPEASSGPTEYNIRTDFLLERGGKRDRRIEVAQDAREVAQLQLLNTIRSLVLDVQNAFVDILQAKENRRAFSVQVD
jgi:cobalt-zinc-cadmium efflux system outer membrane protein